jgi:CDP-diacylglycerol--glycerol-3-phosphate 3-phosphatidyltransferase
MINKKEILTISNLLSFVRLFLAVPFWILMEQLDDPNTRTILIVLCFIAFLTDILDGFVARYRNEITEFGKIIDPLADKVCMGIIIIKLYLLGEISQLFFFIIIGRDLLIFIAGLFLTKKLGKVLPSNVLGKITVVFIGLVILSIFFRIPQDNLWFQSFYLSTIGLIISSLVGYAIRANEILKGKHATI